MDTKEIIDDDENGDVEDKTPFPWKKVLLAPFKVCWAIIVFIIKVVWWLTKLALFFAFVFLGIFIAIGSGFSTRTRGANETYLEREALDEEYANRMDGARKGGSRCFRMAGRIWRSLWGSSHEE